MIVHIYLCIDNYDKKLRELQFELDYLLVFTDTLLKPVATYSNDVCKYVKRIHTCMTKHGTFF